MRGRTGCGWEPRGYSCNVEDLERMVSNPLYSGIDQVMRVLAPLPDGAKLEFLCSRRGSLGGAAVLDALAMGQLARVLAAAEAFVQG